MPCSVFISWPHFDNGPLCNQSQIILLWVCHILPAVSGLIDSETKQIKTFHHPIQWTSLVAQKVKNPPAMRETWVQSLDWDDPLEEAIATHSSILAWRIPMDRGLQCMGLQRVGHDWVTKHCTAPSGSQGSLILLITFFHTFLYFFSYFYGIFFTCPCSPLAS